MSRKNKGRRLTSVSAGAELVLHVILGLFALCCVIPFVFVVIISFSSEESIRTIGYSFIPQEWSLETYRYAFEKLPQIWRSFFNSIFITVVGTLLSTDRPVAVSRAWYLGQANRSCGGIGADAASCACHRGSLWRR